MTSLSPEEIEALLKTSPNPYDVLSRIEQPTLLDIGAGDLSFEEELVNQYLPQMHGTDQCLTIHALDRLDLNSQFAGVYQASQDRLRVFSEKSARHLRFQFWGGVDMFDCFATQGLLSCYSIVTCHAPANPTFAYEPARLSPNIITAHLKKTKGEFRSTRINGEEALEVFHRGRTLVFPFWKFLIRGPLALLELVACKGALCVLSAIDDEVFWEFLAQLVQDEGMRPRDVVFTRDNLQDIFGEVYHSLASLQVGEACNLSDLIIPRTIFQYNLVPKFENSKGFRFRYIEVRRGAIFENMAASFTARQFSHMSEESPPWCIILIPERLPAD